MPISGFVKPLRDKLGNYIFPETSSEAVYCPDGKTVEDKIIEVDSQLDKINNKIGSLTINVKWYGAKGDGINDDTNIIQSVIDKVHLIGGKVYFPIGIYKVSKTLLFYDNVTFEFESDIITKNCFFPVQNGTYINNYLILINSLDGITPYKSVSSSSSDHVDYKGLNINNCLDLSQSNAQRVPNLKGIFLSQAHCKFDRIIGYGLDNTIVLNPNAYLDNIVIENSFFLNVNGYQILKEGEGETLTIRNCKLYESVTNGGINWKLAKVNKTLNLKIENIINGGIEISDSFYSLENLHLEKGQLKIINSDGAIRDCTIYHPNREDYTPLHLNGNWLNSAILENVYFCMTPYEHNVGEINNNFDITIDMNIVQFKNVLRRMFVNYNKSYTTGIKIYSGDTNMMKIFNENSSQLSVEGLIKYCTVHTPLKYINNRRSGNDIISIAIDESSPYTWHNIETDLVYTCQLIHGKDSLLNGVNMLNDVFVHAKDKPVEITINNEYLNQNCYIRLFRGTVRGSYSAYVDIPILQMGKLLDTGTQVNGFPWIYGNYNLSTISTQMKDTFKYMIIDNGEIIIQKDK